MHGAPADLETGGVGAVGRLDRLRGAGLQVGGDPLLGELHGAVELAGEIGDLLALRDRQDLGGGLDVGDAGTLGQVLGVGGQGDLLAVAGLLDGSRTRTGCSGCCDTGDCDGGEGDTPLGCGVDAPVGSAALCFSSHPLHCLHQVGPGYDVDFVTVSLSDSGKQ